MCIRDRDILLTAHNLHGGFVGIGIELFGIFIAAVVVEVGRVYIKQQLPISVSYTHLDVYKRQAAAWAAFRPAPPSAWAPGLSTNSVFPPSQSRKYGARPKDTHTAVSYTHLYGVVAPP